jgi:hypothetical protein
MECERCGAKPQGEYGLHDYCAICSKNLCEKCMKEGCCKNKPAKSGAEVDDHEDGLPPDKERS